MLIVIWICASLLTLVSGNICEKTHCEMESECDCSGGNYNKLGFEQVNILQFTDNNLKLFDIFNKTVVKSQLNLNNNEISSLDNIPKTLHNLQLLYLVNNKITYIGANTFSKFKELRDLRLSYNKISIIDANAFNGAMLLDTLNLSHNYIDTIAFVNHLPKVVSLTLSHNVISNLSPIENANLTRLRTVYLDDNKIVNITISILQNMPSLGILHLENNKMCKEDNVEMRKLKYTLANKKILTIDLNSHSLCCKIEEFIGYNKTCHNCSNILVTCEEKWISVYKYHICSGVVLIVVLLLLGIGTYFVCRMVCTKRSETVDQDQDIQEREKCVNKGICEKQQPLQSQKDPEEDPDGYLKPSDSNNIYEEIEERYCAVTN